MNNGRDKRSYNYSSNAPHAYQARKKIAQNQNINLDIYKTPQPKVSSKVQSLEKL